MDSLSQAVCTQTTENPRVIDWSKFLDRRLLTPPSLLSAEATAKKTILITGAGGSIGSALANYWMGSLAAKLVLVDNSRQNLNRLYQQYKQRNVTLPHVECFLADIRCYDDLQRILSQHPPQIVFHTAAAKHLSRLESAPFVGLENNVLGTLNLLHALDSFDAEYLINVSTDKAVNPTSVLGVSKRITELLLGGVEPSSMNVLSLRLGNVLGTAGSVVPRFLRCIKDGKPLRLTSTRARRYFITLEETVTFLVNSLQVSGNALLLPKMGGQQSVLELAGFLFKEFQGVREMPLLLVGLRDGEKFSEELFYSDEFLCKSPAPHLNQICRTTLFDRDAFVDHLGQLLEIVVNRRKLGLIESLMSVVPEFVPSPTLVQSLR